MGVSVSQNKLSGVATLLVAHGSLALRLRVDRRSQAAVVHAQPVGQLRVVGGALGGRRPGGERSARRVGGPPGATGFPLAVPVLVLVMVMAMVVGMVLMTMMVMMVMMRLVGVVVVRVVVVGVALLVVTGRGGGQEGAVN